MASNDEKPNPIGIKYALEMCDAVDIPVFYGHDGHVFRIEQVEVE